MTTLSTYEDTSRHLINKDKSHFMILTPTDTVDRVRSITGFNLKEGPITYLGCQLFVGSVRVIYFLGMVFIGY